jgi:hypothetical protein
MIISGMARTKKNIEQKSIRKPNELQRTKYIDYSDESESSDSAQFAQSAETTYENAESAENCGLGSTSIDQIPYR